MKNLLIIFIKFLGSILFIGGGLLAVISIINTILISYTASDWIETPAEITYTYSVQAYGGRTNSGLEYAPHPTYSFISQDGKQYKGSTYSIPFGTTRNLDFLKGATEMPAIVYDSIFYNPNNPNQSAVERPIPLSAFFFPYILYGLLALLPIIAGVYLFEEVWGSIYKTKSGLIK